MVIAVQIRGPAMVVDYQCNGVPRVITTSECSRAILSAVLDSVWGIGPPGHWDTPHARPHVEPLLSLNNSPHGYFASGVTVPLYLRDVAKRHQLFSVLYGILTEMKDILLSVDVCLDDDV